jgi:hypothetical protein
MATWQLQTQKFRSFELLQEPIAVRMFGVATHILYCTVTTASRVQYCIVVASPTVTHSKIKIEICYGALWNFVCH